MSFKLKGARIWVAGHKGMVGSAVVRRLRQTGCEILTAERQQVDLTDQHAVKAWMTEKRPNGIILAAAKVGGIIANERHPAEFIYQNLMIEANIIHAAHQTNVERLLFLGSSCIYPKFSQQPIRECDLLTGALEPTNEAYAVAKIAGIKLVQAYRQQYGHDWISAMPTNLYGPNDNYDKTNSHVVAALIRKLHEAKLGKDEKIELFGTGFPLRELLHCDDLADALALLMEEYSETEHINVGSGDEISILHLANLIGDIVHFKGKLEWDHTKPDGTPRKFLDSTKINKLGWYRKIELKPGLEATYECYKRDELWRN